jgi:multidrug transporter EmrE-like cation transporter
MTKVHLWLYIIGAVMLALAANSLSVIWATKEQKLTPWLLAVVLISPFVFISFGLVASKIGLAMSSATVDALLTITTILVGLFLFRERDSLTLSQYGGMFLAVAGILLMQFGK